MSVSRFTYLQTLISNNGVSELPIYYTGMTTNADIKISRIVYRDATKKDTVSLRAWGKSEFNYEVFVAKPLIKPDLFEGAGAVYGAGVNWSF